MREASHNTAGDPEIFQATDRANQRITIGRKGERAIDDFFDAGIAVRREVLEAYFKLGRDTIKIRLQQILPEVPWCFLFGPRFCSLFIGAHQHAAAFLAGIDFAFEIECRDDFFARGFIGFGYFRNIFR